MRRWSILIGLTLSLIICLGFFLRYFHAEQEPGQPQKEDDVRGYLVDNPHCKMTDYAPFHGSILEFYEKYTLEKCTDKPRLTRVKRVNGNHVLETVDESKRFYVNESDHLVCCYSLVRRNYPDVVKHDDDFIIEDCVQFEKSVTFSNDEEFIFTQCYSKVNETMNITVYKNMHSFVRKTSITKKKVEEFQGSNETLSIIMIGIDSMSRLNFKRTMPKMEKMLTDWVELKGYNKVEVNTFPNLMPVLTGLSSNRIDSTCTNEFRRLDGCDFLWKQLSRRNFVTLYTEDDPADSSFNYDRKGFLQSPTDHYQRPFFLAADKKLDRYPKLPFKRCYGPEYIVDHLLNYSIEFMTEYKGHPQFALVWMNTFSHDNVNGATAMDEKYVSYFQKIKELGVYDSSFVIFFSDHGIRFGGFRQTFMGWLEERLPFIYLHLPNWWKIKYPEKYRNLLSNNNKLTSNYDLYLTVKDAMNETEEGTYSCPKCTSLFNPIPHIRSCEDAGIPEAWCACEKRLHFNIKQDKIKTAAFLGVQRINQLLSTQNYTLDSGYECGTLKLKRTLTAFKNVDYKDNIYVITMQTTPGDGIFEVRVQVNAIDFWFTEIIRSINVGSISRVNKYGNQSSCLHGNPAVKPFCFCTKK